MIFKVKADFTTTLNEEYERTGMSVKELADYSKKLTGLEAIKYRISQNLTT